MTDAECADAEQYDRLRDANEAADGFNKPPSMFGGTWTVIYHDVGDGHYHIKDRLSGMFVGKP